MMSGRDPIPLWRGLVNGVLISVVMYLAAGAIILAVRGAQHDLGPNLHLGARE